AVPAVSIAFSPLGRRLLRRQPCLQFRGFLRLVSGFLHLQFVRVQLNPCLRRHLHFSAHRHVLEVHALARRLLRGRLRLLNLFLMLQRVRHHVRVAVRVGHSRFLSRRAVHPPPALLEFHVVAVQRPYRHRRNRLRGNRRSVRRHS